MRWPYWFGGLCAAAVAVIIAALWQFGLFHDMGLSGHGMMAMAIGILLTLGLGIGLMALVFFSARSRHDEAIGEPDRGLPSGRVHVRGAGANRPRHPPIGQSPEQSQTQPQGPRKGSPV